MACNCGKKTTTTQPQQPPIVKNLGGSVKIRG